jgi:hypothetical protein
MAKSATERAIDAVEKAVSNLDKAERKADAAKGKLDEALAEVQRAQRELNWHLAHPELPEDFDVAAHRDKPEPFEATDEISLPVVDSIADIDPTPEPPADVEPAVPVADVPSVESDGGVENTDETIGVVEDPFAEVGDPFDEVPNPRRGR